MQLICESFVYSIIFKVSDLKLGALLLNFKLASFYAGGDFTMRRRRGLSLFLPLALVNVNKIIDAFSSLRVLTQMALKWLLKGLLLIRHISDDDLLSVLRCNPTECFMRLSHLFVPVPFRIAHFPEGSRHCFVDCQGFLLVAWWDNSW